MDWLRTGKAHVGIVQQVVCAESCQLSCLPLPLSGITESNLHSNSHQILGAL